jgi:hypothetical protein
MVSRYAPRQSEALDLARRAFAAGARTSTVEFLTGLDRWALRRYLTFETGGAPKPGKRPDSPERFVKNASLSTMVDASLAYVLYRDHRERWPHAAEALVTSYEHYAGRRKPCELSFDRVFYVVCWTDRIWVWTGREAIFRFTTCARCHCRYLASPAVVDDHERECPFCRVQVRYHRDPRVHNRFPKRDYPEISAALAEIMTSFGVPAESG